MALEVLCQHVRRRPKRNQSPVRAIRVRRRERVDRDGLAVRLDAALGVVEDELGSVRRPIRQAGHRPSEIGVGRRRRQQPTIRTVRAHRGEPIAATANHLRCTRSFATRNAPFASEGAPVNTATAQNAAAASESSLTCAPRPNTSTTPCGDSRTPLAGCPTYPHAPEADKGPGSCDHDEPNLPSTRTLSVAGRASTP